MTIRSISETVADCATLPGLTTVVGTHDTPKARILAIFDLLDQNEFDESDFQKNAIRQLFTDILAPLEREGLADEIYVLFEGSLIANKVYDDPWPFATAREIVKKII